MKEFTLQEIQAVLPGSEIQNTTSPESILITSVAPLESKNEKFLAFISARAHIAKAKTSGAKALIVNRDLKLEIDKPLILVDNAELALAKVLEYMYPAKKADGKIAPSAFIDSTAKVGEGSSIGHFVSIGANSVIGKNCIIQDGVKIGENVEIGDNAMIGFNCVFFDDVKVGKNFIVFGNSSFGGDGFRFVTVNKIHHKVPQIAKVIIGDDVEFGSNYAVDRGGLTDTVIGDGCKFDNMVHVAHNVILGKNVIIAGQSGVAGSTTIEDDVLIGGGTCISDHLHLPAGTIVAGGTGMRTSPKKPDVYIGWDWGMTFAEFQKARVNIKHLVSFNKWAARIKAVEAKLGITEE